MKKDRNLTEAEKNLTIKIMNTNLDFSDYNNGGKDNQPPFRRGVITCSICGEKSRYHCRIREDGILAICRNVSNDRPTTDGKGWVHILKEGSLEINRDFLKSNNNSSEDIRKADADRLNDVYTALLNNLELKERHFNDLVNKRGLSEQNLLDKLFVTVPSYNQRWMYY